MARGQSPSGKAAPVNQPCRQMAGRSPPRAGTLTMHEHYPVHLVEVLLGGGFKVIAHQFRRPFSSSPSRHPRLVVPATTMHAQGLTNRAGSLPAPREPVSSRVLWRGQWLIGGQGRSTRISASKACRGSSPCPRQRRKVLLELRLRHRRRRPRQARNSGLDRARSTRLPVHFTLPLPSLPW